jgi:hypothetical protein
VILIEGEAAPKYSVCVNCLKKIPADEYFENDHVCEDCAIILGPIVNGTGERRKD